MRWIRMRGLLRVSFQNWRSEFLAVAALVGGTIFLRRRSSPQSKPVHASNAETGG